MVTADLRENPQSPGTISRHYRRRQTGFGPQPRPILEKLSSTGEGVPNNVPNFEHQRILKEPTFTFSWAVAVIELPPVEDPEFQPPAWRPAAAGQSKRPAPPLTGNVRLARHDRSIVTKPASTPSFHAGETTPAPILCFPIPSDWWPRAVAARTAPSDPEWIAIARRIRSAAFFWMSQQAAFDTSWMNLRPEMLLD
jgi:hypothetical protein